MSPSSDKDRQRNEVPPGKVNPPCLDQLPNAFLAAMAGAMMVERAGSIPAMEPMDYKEFVAKLTPEQVVLQQKRVQVRKTKKLRF